MVKYFISGNICYSNNKIYFFALMHLFFSLCEHAHGGLVSNVSHGTVGISPEKQDGGCLSRQQFLYELYRS